MKPYTLPGIRLGSTSFLLHEDYVPAVRFTAERCDDVALLLLETGLHGKGLITSTEVTEIAHIIAGEGATLHVHLPTDMDFSTPRRALATVEKIRMVVDRTARLQPHSFVLHVDFPHLRGRKQPPAYPDRHGWDSWTAEALQAIADMLPGPEQLALENLEGFPPRFWDRWLEPCAYSRCFDVGHIWKDGGDPTPLLKAWLPSIRIIHLHGLAPYYGGIRDHRALTFMPEKSLDSLLHPLWENAFTGVLCLELFCFDDFTASHAVLLHSWERYRQNTGSNLRQREQIS